jgi:hypothetical protein
LPHSLVPIDSTHAPAFACTCALPLHSWGTGVGDRGYFKVKYGVCGLMTHGDTYGMYFIPQRPVPLLVTAAPTSSSSDKPTTDARCFVYRGRRDDYMSKVADRAVVPIGTLLADNTGVVRALDKPLTGIRLRMCNPDPAAIGTVKQPTQQERPGGTGGSGKPALPSAGSGTQVGGGGSAGGGSSGGPDRGNSGGGIVDDGGSAGGSVKGIASVLPEAGPAMISTSPPSSSAAKVGVSSSSSPQGLAVADEPPAGEEEAAGLWRTCTHICLRLPLLERICDAAEPSCMFRSTRLLVPMHLSHQYIHGPHHLHPPQHHVLRSIAELQGSVERP